MSSEYPLQDKMSLSIFELVVASLALFISGASLNKAYKSVRRGEWAAYNGRLKTAYIASVFTPVGWFLLFLALRRSSHLLPLLVIATLYYFLISGPVSKELEQQKLREAIHLQGYWNLMTVSKIVEKIWELSGYRCRHELDWSKQDDDAINASWSRKPGQTVVYCNFFQDNTSSEPSQELSQAFSKEAAYDLHDLDDFIRISMSIVMAMSYTHERPCLRKNDLLERVREYCTSESNIGSIRGNSSL